MAEFEGMSSNGNFQEALDKAVKKALNAGHASDFLAIYVVKKISGESGGIAGSNRLTVVISTDAQ